MQQVQTLGKHVVCTSVRDYMVWQSEEGATFQWAAVGDGLMDVPAYVQHLATSCPGVPLFVESISNSARPIPFLQDQWWKGFPDVRAAEIADFLPCAVVGIRSTWTCRPKAWTATSSTVSISGLSFSGALNVYAVAVRVENFE